MISFKSSKNAKPRDSIVSTISEGDVTEDALQVWKSLPKDIRRDSTFVSFKRKDEFLKKGKNFQMTKSESNQRWKR